MSIDASALAALEWDNFLEVVAPYARTAPGRSYFSEWPMGESESHYWAASAEEANTWQALTAQALHALPRSSLWDALNDLPDHRSALERVERGAVLSIEELWVCLRWIRAARVWQDFPLTEVSEPQLHAAMSGLAKAQSLKGLHRELSKVVTDAGEFSEEASPRLRTLHQEYQSLRASLQTQLDQVLRDYDQRGVLQDRFADFRDGRYVVPVRMGSMGEVSGQFLETSASRQTIYVEPAEMAHGNQALSRKRSEIEEERHRILIAMSQLLAQSYSELSTSTEVLVHWDQLHAKARVAERMGGVPITVGLEQVWDLSHAAHPLLFWALEPHEITRNTIQLNPKTRVLLFSGPNTGGKTVFLKTLGMAALFARSGFLFPGEGLAAAARVPFFGQIHCDLGDPQSIAAHLSTFSGHLLKLRAILEAASHGTLVLLDELNSSTDPEEGYALSRALLDALIVQGAWIGATTHDPRLKALALESPAITNASVQFDEKSQRPTYRVLLGSPGRSRALETAERLGIPPAILTAARGYMSESHRAFEEQLSRLERDAQQAAHDRREAESLRTEAARLEREWRTRMDASLQETLARARAKLRTLFASAQEELRTLIVKAHDAKTTTDLEQVRSGMKQGLSQLLDSASAVIRAEAPDLPEIVPTRTAIATKDQLQPGAQVRLPKWKSTGQILEVNGDRLRVAMGGLQMNVNSSEVEFVAPPKNKVNVKHSVEILETQGSELDLRGKRFDEAMSELAAFLDVAYRSRMYTQVRIIHGFGTGALREGTRALLAKLPYVKTVGDSAAQQGGAGATLIEFDR